MDDWAVIWSPSALEDVEQAVRQSARQSGATSAESLRAALFESVRILARLPGIGPIYEDDESGRTREVLCRQYRVFYRPDEAEQRANVIAVLHSARRGPRLPE